MPRFAAALSKALARMHLWFPAAAVLAQTPLEKLDAHSVGRLSYTLMMMQLTRAGSTNGLLHRIITDNQNAAAAITLELAEMATRTNQPALAEDLLAQAEARALSQDDTATADAATRLRLLSIALSDGSLERSIHADIVNVPPSTSTRPLVLAPLSQGYIELFHLWLQQVRKHIGGHVIVMAMDDAAYTTLSSEHNITTLDCRRYFSWSNGKLHARTRGVLWLLRVLYLRALVQADNTMLVLDLDAIPVGDLAPLLQSTQLCDVLAQKDYSLPMDVARQLGFVLCCGFMLWRPTTAAKDFLDLYAAETQVERDDQMALNHLLITHGIEDKNEHDGLIMFRCGEVQFGHPGPKLVSRTLHEGSVVRHFHQQGQSIDEIRKALGLS